MYIRIDFVKFFSICIGLHVRYGSILLSVSISDKMGEMFVIVHCGVSSSSFDCFRRQLKMALFLNLIIAHRPWCGMWMRSIQIQNWHWHC